MATYCPSSNNKRDIMTGIYLKDPSLPSYSEASVHPGNMMMYMNYSSSAESFSDTLAGNSQPQQKSDELPSLGSSESAPAPEGVLSNLGGSHLEEQAYRVWRDGRNEMLFIHPTGGGTSTGENLVHSTVTEDPQVSMQTQLGILHGQNLQGLSLSLSTQIPSAVPGASFHYPHLNTGFSSFLSPHQSVSGEDGNGTGSCENSHREHLRNGEYLPNGFPGGNHDIVREEEVNNLHWSNGPKQMHRDPSPYGLTDLASSIANSKYLKAAQQLLDEVVNVRKSLKKPESVLKSGTTLAPISGGPLKPQESTANASGELSPAERQDLQNKLTKLLSMLDEVDRRFKQYYHQMQIVVSSFDVVAGCGAAKSYTALALQTISRHFRCLRDAISGQIQGTRKSLGEQDTSANSKECGISRLRYVDQQLRQQRALQQLGMVQQNAWRPQRGLPDSSVSILRAWLFEHFLNPYPKDSDKIMLARQTGLTRSQVSNWFINARVRLWKPMIEDIYKEEIGDTEIDSNSSSENAHNPISNPTNEEELQKNMDSTTTERCHPGQFRDLKPDIIPDVEITRGTLEPGFQIAEIGRFVGGNGVSLKLELQNRDAASVPVSGGTHHHNFVTMREDEMYNGAVSSVGPDGEDYDYMDQVNRRSRFGSGHMLRDFVA